MPRVTATEQQATRRRLIEAGKAEFAHRGLAGARFDEISLAAGHAKGTIYNYFTDKEALFFTIVEEWCIQLVAGFAADGERTASGDLLEVARLDVDIARKDPELAAVVINQLPGLVDRHRRSVEAAIGAGLDLLVAIIERGQAIGEFRHDYSASTLARLFLATLTAVEQEAVTGESDITLDAVPRLIDPVVKGLMACPN